MAIAKRQISPSNLWRKAGPLFLLAGLSLLTACAGVSNGPAHFTTAASGQLTVTPATLAFGSVLDGSTGTASGTLTASSASVTVSGVSSSNSLFTVTGLSLPVTIAAGQTVPFTVTFSPQTPGSVSGTLTFTSNGQPSTTVETLTGTGTTTTPPTGQLGVTPGTLALGNVVDGSSGTASGTLTASGGSVIVSAATSSNSVFKVGGLSLPATITAGQSVPFSVTFSPQISGAASATLSFTSNGQPSTTIEILTGTGTSTPPPTGQLAVTPATLALGNVVDGSSGTASGTLTASGGSVTVSAARSNNSVFSVGGLSLPATITAGNSAPFSVTFSPQIPGAVSATLSFTSNGQPSTTIEILTGTGTPAPTHSVALSWNASTSSNVVGYNLYRAVQSGSCGVFSKINTVLNTGTLYTDSAVANGATYCYAATSVDSSNSESSYSNIASNVQIP